MLATRSAAAFWFKRHAKQAKGLIVPIACTVLAVLIMYLFECRGA